MDYHTLKLLCIKIISVPHELMSGWRTPQTPCYEGSRTRSHYASKKWDIIIKLGHILLYKGGGERRMNGGGRSGKGERGRGRREI